MPRNTLTNWRESSRPTSVSGLFACLLSVSLIGASTEADQFSPEDAPPGWLRAHSLLAGCRSWGSIFTKSYGAVVVGGG